MFDAMAGRIEVTKMVGKTRVLTMYMLHLASSI